MRAQFSIRDLSVARTTRSWLISLLIVFIRCASSGPPPSIINKEVFEIIRLAKAINLF